MTIQERLDNLKQLIQQKEFLEGEGLSKEVNIRIFCYDPAEEMVVRHFLRQLVQDAALSCHLKECNLYRVFLAICQKKGILGQVAAIEDHKGSGYLLKQLRLFATDKAFVEQLDYPDHRPGDVLLITGVGEVFPFMRVHVLLEALQPKFSDLPILVMYPGKFNGRQLTLFNRLSPSPYYRAFNVI